MVNVMIVDDDAMVLDLNRRYVERIEGFKVKALASSGEEALSQLINKKIDLIILDIYMPKMDGLSLLKRIRSISLDTDVILVTAAKDAEKIDTALKLGAVDYLIKPFQFERLKESLEKYLRRYQLLKNLKEVNQKDLDKITSKDNLNNQNKIQKGLHKYTLKKIKDFMKEKSDSYHNSDEIGEELGFSKVTVRKYLEYLVEIGEVIVDVEYGSIGRPSHRYKTID
ncbi:MAG: response regulator [Bacillota bacterium]|nr:response regulator [Bacillota bacterium]